MSDETAKAHSELVAQRQEDARNTNTCKFCSRTIIWRPIVYNAFGHFNVIAHNTDGTEHDRQCAERGAPKVTKIED